MSEKVTVSQLTYGPFTRTLNLGARVVQAVMPSLGALEPESILSSARRQSGLQDVGDERFLIPMERVLQAVPTERLTPLAQIFLRTTFVEAVKNRLRIQAYLSAHPEVWEIPIQRPVFVLGFPRSGTTLLQNLLAQDPSRRALQFWELRHPVPVHPDPERDIARRIRATEQILRLAYLVAPEMRYVHEIGAQTAEECWPLFTNTFSVLNFDLQSGARDFGDWLMNDADMVSAYRYYRQELQLLLHRRATDQLVLKCPEHLWFIDALLEVFPDARIIWTHRDPYDSVASYCSLISLTWRMLYGKIDRQAVGEHITYRFHTGVTAAMQARARLGDDPRIYDMSFTDLVRDPAGTIRTMSDQLQLDWKLDLPTTVQNYLNNQRKDKRGAHRYDGALYGLERDKINELFGEYIERYEIELPPPR